MMPCAFKLVIAAHSSRVDSRRSRRLRNFISRIALQSNRCAHRRTTPPLWWPALDQGPSMRIVRILTSVLVFAFAITSAPASLAQNKPPQPGELTLIGKLSHVMGIGGETTGWSLELQSEVTLEGQTLHSIEVSGPPKRLARLTNQDVKARGFVKHHHGVERKDWLVLEISSIRAIPAAPAH